MSRPYGSAATERRLGRALVHLHQHDDGRIPQDVAVEVESLLTAGRAMDLAARLKDQSAASLNERVVSEFAKRAGIGRPALMGTVLPALKSADVIDYQFTSDGQLNRLEEYVGVTRPLVAQAVRVLEALHPTPVERTVLHSIEIASWAPLTESQHLEQLVARGFDDAAAASGYRLALAVGVNRREHSTELREDVVYNPYVWGTGQIPIAAFLRGLPSAERDVLLGVCEQASDRPGLALPAISADPRIVRSARKVGLLQASTVKSTAAGGSSQTYVFSPLLQTEDDELRTTEALHQRKLFVAHILFGHEKAQSTGGRIVDPVVLVRALLSRGVVGPATNIATDYHLLEAQGIVSVDDSPGDRAFLRLVKPEIVRDGLDWLERTTGGVHGGSESPRLLRSPGAFVTPEGDRRSLGDQGAADEVTKAAIMRLREEVKRATRQDDIF